ncbi:MAG: hypothetical protein M1457_12610 [bacterium]|nr:hypothetical protein [bacterium]
MRRFREARRWLRKAAKARRYACFHQVFFNLGRIFESLDLPLKAREVYGLALVQNPRFVLARDAYWRLTCRYN